MNTLEMNRNKNQFSTREIKKTNLVLAHSKNGIKRTGKDSDRSKKYMGREGEGPERVA